MLTRSSRRLMGIGLGSAGHAPERVVAFPDGPLAGRGLREPKAKQTTTATDGPERTRNHSR